MTIDARRFTLDRGAYWSICAILLVDAWLLLARVDSGYTDAFVGDRLAVIITSLGLGLLGLRHRFGSGSAFLAGLLVGAQFFVRTLGLAWADPTRIDWLLEGDWAQHYSGWAMFRAASWTWPPGLLPNVAWPVGTSIVYTDSLPLLALLLKPWSAQLPQDFQYIGLWILLSFCLSGAFGALLTRRWTDNTAIVLVAAALFVFAPVLLNRIGHDTLTAHWLLLAAIWLYGRNVPARSLRAQWPWWLLLALASLVHPYLAAMNLTVYGAWLVRRWHVDGDLNGRTAAIAAATTGAVVVACWWLVGAFVVRFGGGSGGIAYGLYSLNLLGFVNPMGFSRLLPTLPTGQGQYEGFAYLGLGMLGLIGLLLAEAALRYRNLLPHRTEVPLIAVALLTFAFAVSSVVMLGSWTLVDLPMNNRLFGTFRSSGRFVWIAYYLLVIWAIRHTLTFRPLIATMLLGITLAIQIWDLSWIHTYYAGLRTKTSVLTAKQRLSDPRWEALSRGRAHLILVPPSFCGKSPPYLPFLLLAAHRGMTVNTGYLARWNWRAEKRYCDKFFDEIDHGERRPDELYVVATEFVERFNPAKTPLHCETLDGYLACVDARVASPDPP